MNEKMKTIHCLFMGKLLNQFVCYLVVGFLMYAVSF